MNALEFTPSKTTVSMDPVDLSIDNAPESGERSIMWMVRTADGMVGPVSLDLIERGLNLGRVPADAEIAPVDTEQWRPVSSIVQEEQPQSVASEQVAPIVAAPVVPIGQPEFAWPESFAPPAIVPQQPVSHYPVSQQPVSQVPYSGMVQQALAQGGQTEVAATPMVQHAWPATAPSFQGEEPITIPTKSMSPALIAFGATIAACAVIGIGVAILQAL